KDLSNINTVPEHTFATSVKGGANNNTLFLYGAFFIDLVYTFDPQTNLWNIPKIIGDTY
ncbi:850_t:CDS:1, partial [Rhizophagus irregularis]